MVDSGRGTSNDMTIVYGCKTTIPDFQPTFDDVHGIADILLLKKFAVDNCAFKFNDADRVGLNTLLFLLLAASAMYSKNVSTALRDFDSI